MATSNTKPQLQMVLPKAQASRIDLSEVLSPTLFNIVMANADAIGVSPEFILYPMLTATASLMGTNAHISINSEWKEPSILWFIIAAKKGEKKTAALKRVRGPIESLEEELKQEWMENESPTRPAIPPQLVIDYFSFEELHSVMSRNRGQVLGMFDEMSSFYGQLDLFKHSSSTIDRKTLLRLNGGMSWGRNFRNYSGNIPRTAFNITGFIQPCFVFEMLHADDRDGLNDRQLFEFPPERDMFLDELKVPMPDDIPDLKDVFKVVMQEHKLERMYIFDNEGYATFRSIHDELVVEKQRARDENVQGILAKSRGFCARLAMVLHCLETALQMVVENTTNFHVTVGESAVKQAAKIMRHLINQKLIMLGRDNTSDGECLSNRLCRLLCMATRDGSGSISSSEVAQKHISERVGCSYPVEKAVDLMKGAEQLGYGEVETATTPTRRTYTKFRKRKYDQLSENSKQLLKKAKITEDIYNKAFRHPLQEVQQQ